MRPVTTDSGHGGRIIEEEEETSGGRITPSRGEYLEEADEDDMGSVFRLSRNLPFSLFSWSKTPVVPPFSHAVAN